MRKSGCEEQTGGGVNGEQHNGEQLSFHPAARKGKDMIWHLLSFRTREGWEHKTQLVLLAELCSILKPNVNAICNWFPVCL